ncbi:MAG: molecular chaperone HtpG [Clostridia bacterium]|nr:molecular chaperone HtpG [Clostridia bacterium]
MAKKQFKAESKRLLDMMINSIYTHKEIFLRELISNASDAIDKLAYRALTDENVGLSRSDFAIWLTLDKDGRTITIEDNGIGMTREELETNLGTIAKSGSLKFKQELAQSEGDKGDVDVIGQFGVGFYSAFMVADKVTVTTRAYGSEEAWKWESAGADGYTVTEAAKTSAGTKIVLHIKDNAEGEDYDQFLSQYKLQALVKKYSDYVRFPIKMAMEKSRQMEKPADAGDDWKGGWESYTEIETLNSMVPLWQRQKSEITAETAAEFYQSKFGDMEAPLSHITANVEGAVTYKALLFIPAHAPFDLYTREYKGGLQLYSSGVLIMDKCPELVPEWFRFIPGVVDTQDVSLNISREMLQHTRQLEVIRNNLDKKIRAELLKIQKDRPEDYARFWREFGLLLKYSALGSYGANKESLRDLLMFATTHESGLTALKAYVERMPEDQQYIYYAAAEDASQAGKLPQSERILAKGYEILCVQNSEDELLLQILGQQEGKPFKSVNDDDALPQTEEEKAAAEKQAEDSKGLLDFVKETLGDKVFAVRTSGKLVSQPVCMTTEGPITLEMEKYFRQQKLISGMDVSNGMTAQRVLELNPNAPAFAALQRAYENDREKAARYAHVLYYQSLLIAGLPLEDPAAYAQLVCSLME